MSTLTVNDDLYQQVSEAAAAQGKTADEFVGEAVRKALSMVGDGGLSATVYPS